MGTTFLGYGLESADLDSLGVGHLLGASRGDTFRQELSLVQGDEADSDLGSRVDLPCVGYRGIIPPGTPGISPRWGWVMAPLQGEQDHKGVHQSIGEAVPAATPTAPGLEKPGISAF
jgi:hypothetical protein